ncbi:hypothetical protein AB0D34_27950 [Streptomyces sp. NPDC048420]|uniref:hypothetical protein n=1 Tax=Streptomyces sp. NPDC048420 TaxID=3155755 RepID=UPI0034131F5F
MTDHLARLCFEGLGSTGRYTPHAYTLRLQGVEQSTDHVVYLHEVHHATLNDVTAWGSALHVYARLPAATGHAFVHLLDACRTTHESLATFASVRLAAARHGVLDGVLAAYPDYVGLYDTATRLVRQIPGPGRQQLAVSALARLCMQTPVLDTVDEVGLDAFRLADVPDADRPDSRWRWFVRQGPAALAAAAEAADRMLAERFGPAALATDGPDGDLYESTASVHDAAWDAWEEAAYEHLRSLIGATGARTLDLNGHRESSEALVSSVEAVHGDIGLRVPMSDEQRQDDAAVASSVLQQVRHDLSAGDRHRALLLKRAPADLVDVLARRPVHGDRPALIVDARPVRRLAALYRWPDDTLPDPSGEPLVAVRAVVGHTEDDTEDGTEDGTGPDRVVGHALVPEPDALPELAERWGGRGLLAACVSASCLLDTAWTRRWVEPLGAFGPLFVLADVEPDRYVPAWVRDDRQVNALTITVEDSGRRRAALLFTAGTAWWLVLAEDVTVALMVEYLGRRLGPRLSSDLAPFTPVRAAATAVIGHLLATESFVSFDAGSGHV